MLLAYFNITMKYARMSNHNYRYSRPREFVILLPEKLGEMLEEKAIETGYLPDELDVELILRGLNKELAPENPVMHYQFHEYV